MLLPLLFAWVLGTPTLWADSGCAKWLENPDGLLERAAELESKILDLGWTSGRRGDRTLHAELERLQARLMNTLPLIESAPRTAAGRLDEIELRLIRLRRILHAITAGQGHQLSLYLDYVSLLSDDAIYISAQAGPVRFSAEVLEELRGDTEFAKQALRAIDSGSIIRLTMQAKVMEVRIRSRQYGNYRLYGIITDGVLHLTEFTARHNRDRDISRVVARMKEAHP